MAITQMTIMMADPRQHPAAKRALLDSFRRHGGVALSGSGSGGHGGAARLPPSINGVAADFGVTALTIRRWCRRLGIGTYQALAKALGQTPER